MSESEIMKVFKELGLDTQEGRDKFYALLRLIGEMDNQGNLIFVTRLSDTTKGDDAEILLERIRALENKLAQIEFLLRELARKQDRTPQMREWPPPTTIPPCPTISPYIISWSPDSGSYTGTNFCMKVRVFS